MPEKRMLIVPADIVRKIDENRGDVSRSDFIEFLIDSQLQENPRDNNLVTRDALHEFEQGIKDLLRSFMEFFVNYGLELGKPSAKVELEELSKKLQ